jgi:hypothetical protein
MSEGGQSSASLGDALHVVLQQRQLLYGRRVGPEDHLAPNAVVVPRNLEAMGTYPASYVTSLQAMEEMAESFSTLTGPAVQAAFQAEYAWREKGYARRGRTVIDNIPAEEATLSSFAAGSRAWPAARHPAHQHDTQQPHLLHLGILNHTRTGPEGFCVEPRINRLPSPANERPQFRFEGDHHLDDGAPSFVREEAGPYTCSAGHMLYQNRDQPGVVELNSGCTCSFVSARFLHHNLLWSQVRKNPDGERFLMDHTGRRYSYCFHLVRVRAHTTRPTDPGEVTFMRYLEEVAVLLDYADGEVDVCLGVDFTDAVHAFGDKRVMGRAGAAFGSWASRDRVLIKGGIVIRQPELAGTAVSLLCQQLSLEPLPQGHELLGTPPSPAFIEALSHASLAYFSQALSAESLMQMLHVLLTRSGPVLHYLGAPFDTWDLPHYPQALQPDPTLPFTLFPFDATVGNRLPMISLPEEVNRYESMRAFAHQAAQVEPLFQGRRLFNTSSGVRGSTDRGKQHNPSQRRRAQFFGSISALNPRPHTPSPHLLIRLVRHHLDELREVVEHCQVMMDASAQADLPQGQLGPANRAQPFVRMEADWCVARARVAFVEPLLADLEADRPFPNFGLAYETGRTLLANLVRSSRSPSPALFMNIQGRYRRSLWWPGSPMLVARWKVEAEAEFLQLLAAANHLSYLVASLRHECDDLRGDRMKQLETRAAGLCIQTDLNATYRELLAPYGFPMVPFHHTNSRVPTCMAQHIGPAPGDDRGAYLRAVRLHAGLLPFLPHVEEANLLP